MTVVTKPGQTESGLLVGEVLTMDEIKSRYPDQWVLLNEPETNEVQEILRAKVVWHGEDREEMYHRIDELGLTHWGARHTSGPPKDLAFAL